MKYFYILLLIFQPVVMLGQTGYLMSGAAPAAMGNAALSRQDVWALFHNPAGIAHINSIEAGVSYEQRYSLKELSTSGFAIALPAGRDGAIGISGAFFGYKSYNEKTGGLTYARKFSERISGGVKLNYNSINIGNDYGAASVITGEAGMQVKLYRNLWLGTRIYNPTQSKLGSELKEKTPSVFSLGAAYVFSEKFKLEVMTEKSSDEKALMRSGIEYHPVKEFWLRAGIVTQPFSSSFGFGLDLEAFKLDVAAGFHPQLGFTPHLSLGYVFPDKK